MEILSEGKAWDIVKFCPNCGAKLRIITSDLKVLSDQIPPGSYPWDMPLNERLIRFGVKCPGLQGHCRWEIELTQEELPLKFRDQRGIFFNDDSDKE